MGQSLDCSSRYDLTMPNHQHNAKAVMKLCCIGILDFESRVKRFAHPINRGRVTVDQLCKSFEDTEIFGDLRNPFSLVHKLLLSPFFREMQL